MPCKPCRHSTACASAPLWIADRRRGQKRDKPASARMRVPPPSRWSSSSLRPVVATWSPPKISSAIAEPSWVAVDDCVPIAITCSLAQWISPSAFHITNVTYSACHYSAWPHARQIHSLLLLKSSAYSYGLRPTQAVRAALGRAAQVTRLVTRKVGTGKRPSPFLRQRH